MFGGGGKRFDINEFGKLHEIAKHDERTTVIDRDFILPRISPAVKIPILAPKFYSKYECQELEATDPEILDELKRLREIGPKEKYEDPVTENQRYGWYTDPLLDYDRGDTRLHFPQRLSEMVKIKSMIDHADSVTKTKR